MTDETAAPSPRRVSGLAIAAWGLTGAILLSLLYTTFGSRLPWQTDPGIRTLLGYLVFWVPLLVATIAWARSGPHTLRPLLAFRPIDLLWGLVAGLLARSLAGIVDWLVYGTAGLSTGPTILDGAAPSPWMIALTTVVAPVILAPIIEELFFRGVVLSSLRGRSGGRGTAAVAIVGSALFFAVVHLLQVTTVTAAVAVGASTLLIGLATGILVVTTRRLGGAVVAHIVFNGVVLLPALFS